MGSEDREVRVKQNEKVQAQYKARLDALKEKGLDDKAVAKDPILKNLRAKVKKAKGRLDAIAGHEAHVEAMKAKDTKAKKEGGKKKGQQPQGGKKAKAGAAKGKKK